MDASENQSLILREFQDRREDLAMKLNTVSEIADMRSKSEVSRKIEEIQKKLYADNFLIAAFGGFSSGKSTFFNALCGEKIFPSLPTPTTAAIHFLQYGQKPEVEIHYRSKKELAGIQKAAPGEYKTVNLNDPKLGSVERGGFELLQTHSKEGEHSRLIRDIKVTYNAPSLKPEGLIWIDTPGTDSIIEYHKDVTYRLIDRADVILFFIHAPVPFKNSDWDLLKDIRAMRQAVQTDKFFFIVNAIDGIDAGTENEVLSYIRLNLEHKADIKNPQLVPLSAKAALFARMKMKGDLSEAALREYDRLSFPLLGVHKDGSAEELLAKSGLPAFEKTLSDFLRREKADMMLKSSTERALFHAEELRTDMDLERWSAQESLEKVEQTINEKILPELKRKEQGLQDVLKRLDEDLKRIPIGVEKVKLAVQEEVDQTLSRNEDISKGDLKDIIRRELYSLKADLEKAFQTTIRQHYPELESLFQNFNRKIFQHIDIRTESIEAPEMNALSGLNLSDYKTERYRPGGEYYSSGNAVSWGLLGGALAFLVPGGLGFFGGAILGALAGETFDRYSGGYSEGRYETETDTLGYHRDLRKAIQSEMSSLERALRQLVNDQRKATIEHIRSEGKAKISNLKTELKNIIRDKKQAKENLQLTEQKVNEQYAVLETVCQSLREGVSL